MNENEKQWEQNGTEIAKQKYVDARTECRGRWHHFKERVAGDEQKQITIRARGQWTNCYQNAIWTKKSDMNNKRLMR